MEDCSQNSISYYITHRENNQTTPKAQLSRTQSEQGLSFFKRWNASSTCWCIIISMVIFVTGSGVRGSPGRGGASSATGGGGGSPSSAVVATEERQNLTCYACNSQLDSEGCRFPHNMSLAMRRTCPPSHRYCTVTRVDYSVDPGGATRAFSIERNCSEHCTTECVAVGERLRLYMCHSCCSDSLCNTGNEARALLEERLLASRRLAVPLIALLVAACF
ncbi:uncharacterized protein LOC144153052 [Haemaphysalis longicornis]